ncbi:hypothetical protein D3C80_1538950 [compost metagenome]
MTHIEADLGHKAVRTHGDGAPSDTGRDAEARCGIKAFYRGERHVPLPGRRHNRFGDRVFGASFHCRHQSQNLIVFKAFGGHQVSQFRATFGQGARLVERNHADIAQRL